jgi:hypothetical protein
VLGAGVRPHTFLVRLFLAGSGFVAGPSAGTRGTASGMEMRRSAHQAEYSLSSGGQPRMTRQIFLARGVSS